MLKERIAPDFEGFGLELTEVQVQDIGLPEEVERAIDKSGAIKAVGDLRAFTQYQTAESIQTVARQTRAGPPRPESAWAWDSRMANQMGQAMSRATRRLRRCPAFSSPWRKAGRTFRAGSIATEGLVRRDHQGDARLESGHEPVDRGRAGGRAGGGVPERSSFHSPANSGRNRTIESKTNGISGIVAKSQDVGIFPLRDFTF